jgi:hypothetical protein
MTARWYGDKLGPVPLYIDALLIEINFAATAAHTLHPSSSSGELFTCAHSDYMQTAAGGIINFFCARCAVCSTEILLSSLLNLTVCRACVYLCADNEITPNKLFCGVWRAFSLLPLCAYTCKLNARRRCHPVICYLWGARLISDFDGHSTGQVFSMCAKQRRRECRFVYLQPNCGGWRA